MRVRINCPKKIEEFFAEEYVTIHPGDYDVIDLEAAAGTAAASRRPLSAELYLLRSTAALGKSAIISVEVFEALKTMKLMSLD